MRGISILILVLMTVITNAQNIRFEDYFEDRTLRLDCYHSGRVGAEYFTIERYSTKEKWAGTTTKLIDNTNNGAFKIELIDTKSQEVIYSRGYCSLFEEWLWTKETKTSCGNFEETLLVPLPKHQTDIVLNSRDSLGNWKRVVSIRLDKNNIEQINIRKLKHYLLNNAGQIHNKLDVVIVPAGYALEDSVKMRKDLRMFSDFMFSKPPFDKAKSKINIWGVEYFSEQSGIPGLKNSTLNPDTELGVTYNSMGSERYIMTQKIWNLHNILSDVPCDQIVIMCNSSVYGGGGIYNYYATTYVNPDNSFVLIHEFGHSFAGLGDEYSDHDVDVVGAEKEIEPWQINVTSLKDFSKKWKDMISPNTPVPTPVTDEYKDSVGVFEGAAYSAKGLYRPYQSCLMRKDAPFCPVCTKQINQMLDFYNE